MTIKLDLPVELEARLTQEAARRATSPEAWALTVLEANLPAPSEASDDARAGDPVMVSDYWKDFVGVVSLPANASANVGRKFADEMVHKHNQGKL